MEWLRSRISPDTWAWSWLFVRPFFDGMAALSLHSTPQHQENALGFVLRSHTIRRNALRAAFGRDDRKNDGLRKSSGFDETKFR